MDNEELFSCIDHVAYACPDALSAAEYYTTNFGWHELHREENQEQGVLEIMMTPTSAPAGQASQVQILSPLREDSTVGQWLAKNRPGLHHMAWRCADIDATGVALRQRGIRLLYDEPRRGTHNSRINFIHPKSGIGVLIELVQPAEEG